MKLIIDFRATIHADEERLASIKNELGVTENSEIGAAIVRQFAEEMDEPDCVFALTNVELSE